MVRDGINIIFVLDTSGSMEDKLNIKKLKEILNKLNNDDEIGIITFSERANIKLEMSKINNKIREKIKKILDEIILYGKTNINDGLKKTFELLKMIKNNKKTKIILITDGEENIELEEIKEIKKSNYILNIIGIGEINSIYLKELSDNYNGIFRYIEENINLDEVILKYIYEEIKEENNELLEKLRDIVKNENITYNIYNKYMNEIEDDKIRISILNNNYNKWGRHYLISKISELENNN